MQVPRRKPGKYTFARKDINLTQAAYDQLVDELERLRRDQPRAAQEVMRLAEMGDFSENAAYQMAKGRLRAINQKIEELEGYLRQVVIITPPRSTDTVQLGSVVEVDFAGTPKVFTILGSEEVDLSKGVISHVSPIGAALMGHRVGDVVTIMINNRTVTCAIKKISIG